jgi:hypothetical protein
MQARLIADDAEEAFLYDLSVAPQWREAFNAVLDEEVEVPEDGSVPGCRVAGPVTTPSVCRDHPHRQRGRGRSRYE